MWVIGRAWGPEMNQWLHIHWLDLTPLKNTLKKIVKDLKRKYNILTFLCSYVPFKTRRVILFYADKFTIAVSNWNNVNKILHSIHLTFQSLDFSFCALSSSCSPSMPLILYPLYLYQAALRPITLSMCLAALGYFFSTRAHLLFAQHSPPQTQA